MANLTSKEFSYGYRFSMYQLKVSFEFIFNVLVTEFKFVLQGFSKLVLINLLKTEMALALQKSVPVALNASPLNCETFKLAYRFMLE